MIPSDVRDKLYDYLLDVFNTNKAIRINSYKNKKIIVENILRTFDSVWPKELPHRSKHTTVIDPNKKPTGHAILTAKESAQYDEYFGRSPN